MPTCIIDGKEIEFKAGENLVEVAKRAGIEIPVFCYHPGLSVVAQCRMCAIEIEKTPKLQTACSTEAKAGMVVFTKSEKVKKNQNAIMEFLLLNHPLDCPICDKSGECDLQDQSFKFGSSYMRTTEDRRTYLDLDMGPVIKKNMNRCIHCTRCIRFGDQIAGIREMVALKRGNWTEITTLSGGPLETEYAGNYSDICPTGSLTLKDFRFNKRSWMLKRTASVCEGCSRGCNIEIQEEGNTIYRCVARENLEINKYWICDEGRFNYQYLQREDRVRSPRLKDSKETSWDLAMTQSKGLTLNKKVAVLIGTDLTIEEMSAIREFSQKTFPKAEIYHFGTPGVNTAKEDDDADSILKRKSKTSNLHGAERLGLTPFKGISSGTQCTIVFRGGRAVLPNLSGVDLIGVGVFFEPEAEAFAVLLPGPAFAEKEGSIVNFQGIDQKLVRAINPPRTSKTVAEVLMLWMHGQKAGGAV